MWSSNYGTNKGETIKSLIKCQLSEFGYQISALGSEPDPQLLDIS